MRRVWGEARTDTRLPCNHDGGWRDVQITHIVEVGVATVVEPNIIFTDPKS